MEPGGRSTGQSEARGDQWDDQNRANSTLPVCGGYSLCSPGKCHDPGVGGQGDLRALQHHSDILRSLTYKEKGLSWLMVLELQVKFRQTCCLGPAGVSAGDADGIWPNKLLPMHLRTKTNEEGKTQVLPLLLMAYPQWPWGPH